MVFVGEFRVWSGDDWETSSIDLAVGVWSGGWNMIMDEAGTGVVVMRWEGRCIIVDKGVTCKVAIPE